MNVWWMIGLRLECVSTFFLAVLKTFKIVYPLSIIWGDYTHSTTNSVHLPITFRDRRREIIKRSRLLSLARSRYLARCHNYSVVHISVCFKSWFVRQSCSVLWDSSRVTTNANGTLFLVSHHSWCTAAFIFHFYFLRFWLFSLFMTPLFMFMLLERWWKLFSLFILAPISRWSTRCDMNFNFNWMWLKWQSFNVSRARDAVSKFPSALPVSYVTQRRRLLGVVPELGLPPRSLPPKAINHGDVT